MKNLLAISLICATSASLAQSEISNELYETPAGYWFATEQCAIQGRIRAETAAFGKQMQRVGLAQFKFDQDQFNILLAALAEKYTKALNPKLCNYIAMEIEDLRLQHSTAAAEAQVQGQAKAQLEEQEQRKAQAAAQLEQQQRREAQVQAQLEQQQLQANAAARRKEIEAMTQQFNQIGQQFRDFGNSVQPRSTNCVRTMMGANCTSY